MIESRLDNFAHSLIRVLEITQNDQISGIALGGMPMPLAEASGKKGRAAGRWFARWRKPGN
jgi:hypothetical protein